MKKTALLVMALLALLLGTAATGDARGFGGHYHGGGGHFYGGSGHFYGGGGHFHGGSHGHFGVSVLVGPGVWPWWGPAPYYGYGYGYQSAPVIVQSEPETIVVPSNEPARYWYYCTDPAGYYPNVPRCPGGWLKVVPRAPEE